MIGPFNIRRPAVSRLFFPYLEQLNANRKNGPEAGGRLSCAKENCGGTVPKKKLNGRTCSEFVRLASSFLNLWTVGFHCSF
jgi:hypothetical protein